MKSRFRCDCGAGSSYYDAKGERCRDCRRYVWTFKSRERDRMRELRKQWMV